MSRSSRIVVPGLPHHVTQRGNRREAIFFEPGDEQRYLDLLTTQTGRHGVEVWAYCLMPNHVHLILTPADEPGLARAVGETHRRYTTIINARHGWSGHLFQARFASTVMDEGHLLTASRYVALNPVRARLVARAEDWPWSSVRAHLAGRSDGVVVVEPLLSRIDRFADTLEPNDADAPEFTALRVAETAGLPLGDAEFVADVRQRRAGTV
ncbi:MAG: transposase [Caulobacter sp.]|nr:transposase [Caulobacter sp.]